MFLATFKLNNTSAVRPPLVSNSTKSASIVPQCPWSQRRSTLHVAGKIGNVKCTWLLDTGSDVTCISSRLPGIEKWQLNPLQSVPAAANGNSLRCLGEIVTSIEIGHVVKHNVRLLVIQNLNVPAILGMDTLQKFGSFGIDWTHRTLTLGDAKLLLDKRCHGSVLSPVVVSLISDHIIPPRSQCFVHAGSTDYGPGTQDALFSPLTDKMARLDILVGAGVVTAGPQNQIPVTVMNNSEHPVKLFAGTRIGALSPIKVEEEHPDVNTVTANPPPPPTVPKQGPAAVNLDSCEVTASEKQELKQLLDDYRDVFAMLTMIQKLVVPTELSFASTPRPRSLLLLSFGELPSLYVLRLISRLRTWNSGVSLSLPILPILHLFCLCLKQMARTVSVPTSVL